MAERVAISPFGYSPAVWNQAKAEAKRAAFLFMLQNWQRIV